MNKELRKLSIMKTALYDPLYLKKLILTKRQIELIKWIIDEYRYSHVNSKIIASDLHITLVNASMQLGILYKKGYLHRINTGSLSGGKEFQYRLTENTAAALITY